MRLSTIWTLPTMPVRKRFSLTNDWLITQIAIKLPQAIKDRVKQLDN